MYILAIDTTAKTASVCLAEQSTDGVLLPLSRHTVSCGFTHSETLLPMIDGCLSDAGISCDDLGLIAVSAGPGSFTGVRIGVSCAKGISFALEAKGIAHSCAAVSSLEALALNVKAYSGHILCPVMDARRSQFYNALFKVGRNGALKRLCPDGMPTAQELYDNLSESFPGKKVLLAGDGAFLCKKLFDQLSEQRDCTFKYEVCDTSYIFQDAFSVACAAVKKDAVLCDGAALSPIYLRASQAERERLEKEANKQ